MTVSFLRALGFIFHISSVSSFQRSPFLWLKAFLSSGGVPPACFPHRCSVMSGLRHCCPDLLVLTTQAQTLESGSISNLLGPQALASCLGHVSPESPDGDRTGPQLTKVAPDSAWWGFTFSFLVKYMNLLFLFSKPDIQGPE